MKLKEASDILATRFVQSCGCEHTPREADSRLNDACRACIGACKDEHGAAWLGRVNHYEGDPVCPVWEWDGESPVYNFGADFVMPVPSEEVVLRIAGYRATPLSEIADWPHQLEKINEAIKRAGGVLLAWS